MADAIPDFIPGIGFINDATFIAWLFKAIDQELNQFKAGEKMKQD